MSISLTDVESWSNQTAGGVRYRLMEGYPRGSFSQEGGNVQEQYLIQTSDLTAFIAESFPLMEVVDEQWVYAFNRAMPGNYRLTTRKVGFQPFPEGKPCNPWEGHGSTSGSMSDFLKVTIDYESSKNEDDNEDPTTFLEISCDASAEFLMLPVTKGMQWELAEEGTMNPLKVDNRDQVTVPKLMPEISWNLRWPRVTRAFTSILIERCRDAMGLVNNAAMPMLFGAPVETILFTGFSMREEFGWREEEPPAVEFDMKLLEKNVTVDGARKGHNEFFRPETGKWETLFRWKPGGPKMYESTNLNGLWA